jgi:hypothetical protein
MVDHGDAYQPITRRIQRALRNCCYAAVQKIECERHGEVVQLHGRLPSFYLKQIAQTVAAQHAQGSMAIVNCIEVHTSPGDAVAGQ